MKSRDLLGTEYKMNTLPMFKEMKEKTESTMKENTKTGGTIGDLAQWYRTFLAGARPGAAPSPPPNLRHHQNLNHMELLEIKVG